MSNISLEIGKIRESQLLNFLPTGLYFSVVIVIKNLHRKYNHVINWRKLALSIRVLLTSLILHKKFFSLVDFQLLLYSILQTDLLENMRRNRRRFAITKAQGET